MSDRHPENILPGGPTELNRASIDAETSLGRTGIAFSAGFIGLAGLLTVTEVAPELIEAVHQLDAGNIAQYGVLGGAMIGLSLVALSNIGFLRRRLAQASYNRKLIPMNEQFHLDS